MPLPRNPEKHTQHFYRQGLHPVPKASIRKPRENDRKTNKLCRLFGIAAFSKLWLKPAPEVKLSKSSNSAGLLAEPPSPSSG